MKNVSQQDRMRGVLLGTAVGDALGLPAEGISRRRIGRLFPGPWRHRLLLGRGMLSDDTEHTVFVGQALLAHPDSPERFARRLGWSLRGWLLALPAGIGLATGRAIFRLWLGFPPHKSGVFSAGNGPAMRVAPIGVLFSADKEKRQAYVAASTRLTHSDPRALIGARAVAEVCAWCFETGAQAAPAGADFIRLLRACGKEDREWQEIIDGMAGAIDEGLSVPQYADTLGMERGVSGYIYRTVPVACYAWLRYFGDYERALTSVLDCGGDTDTAGAIVGAMAGAVVGEAGIPGQWIDGIADWPRGMGLLRRIADRLTSVSQTQQASSPVGYFWPGVLVRNLLFLAVVLLHGFRRLLPPY